MLGKGEGDYCIYEIASGNDNMPKGSLIPIPGIPRFEDTKSALTWIRVESRDLLAGKEVMVIKACEILRLVVENKPIIQIVAKHKISVDPVEKSDG